MVAKAGSTIQQQIVEILQEQVCVLGVWRLSESSRTGVSNTEGTNT
jgi:uncharacterized membrane protein affecting hemolysin expression